MRGRMDRQTDKEQTNLDLPESGHIMGIRVTRATRPRPPLAALGLGWTGIARSQSA